MLEYNGYHTEQKRVRTIEAECLTLKGGNKVWWKGNPGRKFELCDLFSLPHRVLGIIKGNDIF